MITFPPLVAGLIQLTPCGKVLHEKLTVPQLFKKIPRVLWNQKFHHGIHKSEASAFDS
jgi:hypothetical protein